MSVGTAPRPFLKWAGGKRQLLPAFRPFYPDRVPAYFEPFVGSGAVFFDLWQLGRLEGATVRLTDGNADLIGCYLRLRDACEAVLDALEPLAAGHARAGAAHYYDIRDRHFNPQRARWRAEGGRAADYPVTLAAMLIYLNRTGYNGLFRQNARGEFNVPAGRYTRPRILDPDRLRRVSAILRSPDVTVAEAPFEDVGAHARPGDLVYFDPPYAPLSETAAFRSYTPRGFGEADQARLQALAIELARRGVHVMLSNSTAPAVAALYEASGAARRAGLRVHRLPARRAINSRADRRGRILELLVTNREAAPPA